MTDTNKPLTIELLNSTNYHGWSKKMQVYLKRSGYLRFIEKETFDAWYAENSLKEDQQTRYEQRRQAITTNDTYDTAEKKQVEYDKLDTLFHNDLGRWSSNKHKAMELWRKEEEIVRGIIETYISDNLKLKIKKDNTAFQIWNTLKKDVGDSNQNLLYLFKLVFNIKFNTNEKLSAYLSRYENNLEKLIDACEAFRNIPEIFHVYLVLGTLPVEYDQFAQNISGVAQDQLTINHLRNKFAQEDNRKANSNPTPPPTLPANQATAKTPIVPRKCSKCSNPLPKTTPKNHKLCSKCYVPKKTNTPQQQPQQQQQQAQQQQQVHQHAQQVARNACGNVVICGNINIPSDENFYLPSNPWYMDSGCGAHISNDRNDFISLSPTNSTIIGPTGETSKVEGVGTAHIIINDNNDQQHAIQLNNALLNNNMVKKLMSAGRITSNQNNNAIILTGDDCLVYANAKIVIEEGDLVMKGKKTNENLYAMSELIDKVVTNQSNDVQSFALSSSIINNKPISLEDLHILLGHLGSAQLLKMADYYNIKIIDPKATISCDRCAQANIRRSNFKKGIVYPSVSPGSQIASDICGKLKPQSYDKKNYFVTYICTETKYIFIVPIAKKSDIDESFKNVRAYIFNQINERIKRFISDGEGKYTSNDFQAYLKSKGIVHQQTPLDTPQRNPMSERINLTILNILRAIMTNVPKKLWSEACNYIEYLLNCTIEKGQSISKYERFHQKKPDLKHIHRFGTYVVYKNNRPDRLKMDDKGLPGIYVGYNYDDLTYRIYDMDSRKVINSRDVKFFPEVEVRPELDEQLVISYDEIEEEFELEDIIHREEDDDEDDLLFSPSPSIPNSSPTKEVTGVRIEPIQPQMPTVRPATRTLSRTIKPTARQGAVNTRGSIIQTRSQTNTLNAIEGVDDELDPHPVCFNSFSSDPSCYLNDTHSHMNLLPCYTIPMDDTSASSAKDTFVNYDTPSFIEGVDISLHPPSVCDVPSHDSNLSCSDLSHTLMKYDLNDTSPEAMKKKLAAISDYLDTATNDTIDTVASMLSRISPIGDHSVFRGELVNTPHPVCDPSTHAHVEEGEKDVDNIDNIANYDYVPVNSLGVTQDSIVVLNTNHHQVLFNTKNSNINIRSNRPISSDFLSIPELKSSSIIEPIKEPSSYKEAVKSPKWRRSIEEEINSLNNLNVWKLSDIPTGVKPIPSQWVFKLKVSSVSGAEREKTRLVACGNYLKYGYDNNLLYSPVIRMDTIRLMFAIGAAEDLELHSVDFDTAFLNSDLPEVVYMQLPDGLKQQYPNKCVALQRALYGLPQSSKAWYEEISKFLISKGFISSDADPCLFILKNTDPSKVNDALGIYVDDSTLMGHKSVIQWIKDALSSKYKIKDLGPITELLRIEVDKSEEGVSISQSSYVKSTLAELNFSDIKTAPTPSLHLPDDLSSPPLSSNQLYRKAVGSLNWLSVCTRPDITYSVSVVSRSLENPTVNDWNRVKHIFRYLKGTMNAKILYSSALPLSVSAYSDASFANAPNSKSMGGYVFLVRGGAISWCTKKQTLCAQNTMEAELMTLCSTVKHAIWLQKLCRALNVNYNPIKVYEDNQSCIKFLANNQFSSRSKHIDVQYQFVRDMVADGS